VDSRRNSPSNGRRGNNPLEQFEQNTYEEEKEKIRFYGNLNPCLISRAQKVPVTASARKRNFVMASISFLDMLSAEKNPFKLFPDNC